VSCNRLTDVAEGLAIGVRVSPADRNNVGTVTAIDEQTGTATVDFVSANGTHAARNFDWDDLRLIDPPNPRWPTHPTGNTHSPPDSPTSTARSNAGPTHSPNSAEHPGAHTWDDTLRDIAERRLDHALEADTHGLGPATSTPGELFARSDELDQILDTAPADCRHIISELRAGQLSLDDTVELLDTALAQQNPRRAWIIKHWPHIVE
jgi:hypothetical protein